MTTIKTFHVYKRIDGQWKFWFNGRGISAADLRRRVLWVNKGKIHSDDVEVREVE